MKHAGVSGVRLSSVCVEMEAYNDQAAATSNQFCWSSQAGKLSITSRVVELERSIRSHMIFNNFFSSNKYMDSVR